MTTVRKIAEWLLALSLAGLALLTVWLSLQAIRIPYQVVYAEGMNLYAGLRMAQGISPYPDPRQWPIVLDTYGPVTYLAIAIPVKLFGVGFTAPRLVEVLAGIAVSILLALLIRHYTGQWAAAVAFGALFLCVPPISLWIVTLRVDLLAVALALAGLLLFVASPRFWYLATLCWVAVIYCKWTMVAAPAACVLWLLSRKQGRKAARLAGLTALLTLVLFGAMEWWSRGHFAFHMFRTHPDPYSFLVYLEQLRRALFRLHAASIGTAIFFLIVLRKHDFSLPAAYIPLALLGAATVGKFGSDTNHMLEATAALCLGGGLGWAALSKLAAGHKAAQAALAVAALAVAALVFGNYRFVHYRQDGCTQAYRYVRALPGGLALAEDVGAVVLAGKTPAITDPWIYSQLVRRAGWTDSLLREKLRQRAVDYVILGDPESRDLERWTLPVLGAIQQNYHPVARFDCVAASVVYAPNQQLEKGGAR